MTDRATLEESFKRTDYVVMLPDGELVLKIGRRDPDADRRLVATTGCRQGWQLVTPCNPHAQKLSEQANRLLLANFHQTLRDWGGTWHATLTRTPKASWPEEPGALLIDADAGFALQLAREYHQVAYVAARLGEAPGLVWVEGTAGR